MSEWPEALVEKVARFLHDRHCRCGSDQVVSTDAEDARRLLDALGLRVSEEFRISYSYGVNSGQLIGWDVRSMVDQQQRVTYGPINVDKVERRDNLNAVTPWEDV